MNDDQIKHMVDRFLGWKLPADFRPDGGITFKAEFNEHTAHPMRHEPAGTNLLDARQAEAMVRFIVSGMPARRMGDAIANAYYEGFVECSKHKPWDDMFDWAALKGQEHARGVLAPREPA